jgi:hypothetical protein
MARKKKPNPLNPGPGLAYAPILDEPHFPYHWHAPEPWRDTGDEVCSDARGLSGNIVCDKPKFGESAKYWPANAERIVNCVNALEGVHNPSVLPPGTKDTPIYQQRPYYDAYRPQDGLRHVKLWLSRECG